MNMPTLSAPILLYSGILFRAYWGTAHSETAGSKEIDI